MPPTMLALLASPRVCMPNSVSARVPPAHSSACTRAGHRDVDFQYTVNQMSAAKPPARRASASIHERACYPNRVAKQVEPAVQVAAACCAEIRRAVRVTGRPHAPFPRASVRTIGV